MSEANKKVFAYLLRLISAKSYEIVSLSLNNGEIVHVREEKNLKPNELPRTGRFANESTREVVR
jgi:hypothetical protein